MNYGKRKLFRGLTCCMLGWRAAQLRPCYLVQIIVSHCSDGWPRFDIESIKIGNPTFRLSHFAQSFVSLKPYLFSSLQVALSLVHFAYGMPMHMQLACEHHYLVVGRLYLQG
jgi:hypothetical protein